MNPDRDAPKPRRRSGAEVAAALFVCILAAVALHGAWILPTGTLHAPEAGFVPLVEALLLAIAGIILMAEALAGRRKLSIDWPQGEARNRVIGLAAALFGYVLALAPLGFTVATFLFLCIAIGTWRRYRWWVAAAYALAMAAGLHLVFSMGLRMSLPPGWWAS